MSWFWAVVAAALIQYALAEVLGGFLVAARGVVRASARRLPAPWRERYEAEWIAELEAVPGSGLLKLVWAAQLRVGAARTARVLEDALCRDSEAAGHSDEQIFSFTAAPGRPALTVRERQVADLAAQGLTNKQIAEALFVTIKTVEWHLHHARRKMGRGSTLGGG